MNYVAIESTRTNNVMIIRLNRPDRMNAVNETMYREIQDVLQKTDSDNDIRSLVITGSVVKRGDIEKQAFCAGADVEEVVTNEEREPTGRADGRYFRIPTHCVSYLQRQRCALLACTRTSLPPSGAPLRWIDHSYSVFPTTDQDLDAI